MSLFDDKKTVELRVLGPNGKPYVDLDTEFRSLFREEGYEFRIPRLFSAPAETTVLITFGIAVLTGVSTHLINKLIDRIFEIKKDTKQKNTTITINLQIGDQYIKMPDDKVNLIKKLEEIKENEKSK